jgi:uncharacterized membrane protein
MQRINSIDIARGLVMIIMALDHTRDLLHTDAIIQSPTNLATTTPVLFFTRWITHLCAPSFVFLSGTSAWLSARKGDAGESRRWLFKRGIFLVVLELTLVNFSLWYDIHFRSIIFQVIAAIGFGFIGLGLMYKLPLKTLGVIGLSIICLHDLLLLIPMTSNTALQLAGAWSFGGGLVKLGNVTLILSYPVLPWFGLMLAGFACGRLFGSPIEVRKKQLRRIGLIALGLFILLRAANVYGDRAPWSVQKSPIFTFMSFMNVSKYPPSLLYTLVTLGLLFLFLSFIDGKESVFTRIATVYGKVPMFYYLIHWNLIHLLMLAMVFLQGFHADQLVFGTFQFGRPPNSGISLPWVYLVWLCVVAALYPMCIWYGRYKSLHPEKRWLRYL